jgi:hypothetical protein
MAPEVSYSTYTIQVLLSIGDSTSGSSIRPVAVGIFDVGRVCAVLTLLC